MSYYAENAREGDGNCNAGHMADIGDARVVSASGDTAVVAIDYTDSARSNAGTNACSGMGSREFTLAKDSTGWGVAGMAAAMSPNTGTAARRASLVRQAGCRVCTNCRNLGQRVFPRPHGS